MGAPRYDPKLSKAENQAKADAYAEARAKSEPMFAYLNRVMRTPGSSLRTTVPPDWGTSGVGRILFTEWDSFGKVIQQY